MLNEQEIEFFEDNGYVILKSFFDTESEIQPILKDIYQIIGLVIRHNNLPIKQDPFTFTDFDSGFQELISMDRRLGGTIYDAVKQIPSFMRICTSFKMDELFKALRLSSTPGIAAGGYGIRINNPGEEKYRAEWHQEYVSQLRSPDGLVFWSPLKTVSPDLGPVQIAVASHKEGILPVHTKDPVNPDKKGAYSIRLANEKNILAKYKIISPLSQPGDLIIMDFATIHASGYNKSARSLWSMQYRYFNFNNPVAIKNEWCGSFASGINFEDKHPEYMAE